MTNNQLELRFSDVDIYYNYVFDVGRRINPIDAARQILRTDLAQAFRNYSTGKSEVADRYKVWVEAYEKLLQLRDDLERIKSGPNLAGHVRILLSNPRMYGRMYLQILKAAFGPSGYHAPAQKEEGHENVEHYINEVAEAIADLLALLAFEEHVDHEIFSSGYIETIPFARVGLQPFGALIDDQQIDFDVVLTIHRSGIAILTAYGVFPGSLSIEELLRLERCTSLYVREFDLPSCAIERYLGLLTGHVPNRTEVQEFEAAHSSTRRGYVRLEGDDQSTLGAAFDTYRYFLIEAIHGKRYRSIDDLHKRLRSSDWLAYPMLFIKRTEPGYTSGTAFKGAYSQALARVITGLDVSSALNPKIVTEVCDQDLSLIDSYSLYLTEGSGTAIYYENFLDVPQSIAANEWIRQKFLTSVVVDLLLLQKGILSTLSTYIDKATYDLAQLNELKKEYILGLEEFEALRISHYGSVHDIIKRGHGIFRIDDLRSLFLLKLQSIEGLIEVVEKKQQVNRERIVKVLTTLATTVLGLKAAQDVVEVLLGWPLSAPSSYPGFIRSLYSLVIGSVTQHATLVTLFLYLATVLITLAALWHEWPSGLLRRKRVLEARAVPRSSERTVSPVSFVVSEYVKPDDGEHQNRNPNEEGA